MRFLYCKTTSRILRFQDDGIIATHHEKYDSTRMFHRSCMILKKICVVIIVVTI